MIEMRVYVCNIAKSDERFLGCGLLFIGKPNSYATDQAKPNQGFRPCIPKVLPELTKFFPTNLFMSMKSLIKIL
jgi:hypothetical protein